jgi:ketosteroid isomerase-like protein
VPQERRNGFLLTQKKIMKLPFLLAGVMLWIAACQSHQPKENKNSHEALVKAYFDCFNRHDWKELSNFYAEEAAFRDPSLGKEIVYQSRSTVEKKYSELHAQIPDVNDEIKEIYSTGNDQVVVEFVSRGTGPDQKPFALPICAILHFKNGKITKDFTYYDL